MTYAHANNGGELTSVNGGLLNIGTSPRERMLISVFGVPYTSNKPNDITMAGTAKGTSDRKSINGRACGRRSCTQYAVGVTSTIASTVEARANSREKSSVLVKSPSAKIC